MPELPLNVYALVRGRIVDALDGMAREGALPAGLDLSNVEVSPPRDASHGDLACNAAMALAKAASMKPRDIADKLAAKLKADPDIEKVEVAGPGFLNMSFVPAFWHQVVAAILDQGAPYGRAAIGKGDRVDVEFVSANPTAPPVL
jgi:arginyl-tRNA synthetase